MLCWLGGRGVSGNVLTWQQVEVGLGLEFLQRGSALVASTARHQPVPVPRPALQLSSCHKCAFWCIFYGGSVLKI